MDDRSNDDADPLETDYALLSEQINCLPGRSELYFFGREPFGFYFDNTVFVGSFSGSLYALDGTTGAQLWSANAGAEIYHPDEQNVSQPVTASRPAKAACSCRPATRSQRGN